MLDRDGFRPNVGIILLNHKNQVFWGKRIRTHSWQFPQGGINADETAEQAMYRELHEEVGLTKKDVEILGVTRGWLRYRLPKRMIRRNQFPLCIGQKQKWFMLRMLSRDEAVKIDCSDTPEFDGWRWVSYWYPVGQVVSFKKEVYRKAMRELSPRLIRIVKR